MNDSKNHLLIDACFGREVERTPVWIMRQAGRYLPEYRAIRADHDFMTMCKTPELVTEVTLQPVDIIGVDAAIIFSDILVIPEAMGMELQFVKGKGPWFPSPLREAADVNNLRLVNAEEDLKYVMDAVKMLRGELNDRVPLIGFSGAPWTLAAYMVEGGGSKNFKTIKSWRWSRPDLLHTLLRKITDAAVDYINAKIDAGAQVIQIFDSWAGLLDEEGYQEFALDYASEIIARTRRPEVPMIYFAKGAGIWLDRTVECGADVIGLDWTVNIETARQATAGKASLQGNLDPTALYADPKEIRQWTRDMLRAFGGRGHVANLGHGILPDIPVDHARAFVDAVKEESLKLNPTPSI